MLKKLVVITVVCLFLFCNFSFSVLSDENSGNLNSKTLYVGGGGTGNYTKIQDAIDDSNDGDTVYVYSGTYYEFIRINNSIILQGENKHSTIIDGNSFRKSIIVVRKKNTHIKGFTIRNAPFSYNHVHGKGIFVESNYNIISDNILTDLYYGIDFKNPWNNGLDEYSKHITIRNCTISKAKIGIRNYYGDYFNIYNNTITDNDIGIQLDSAWYNTIYNNIFENNECGIFIDHWYMRDACGRLEIKYNSFIKNIIAMDIYGALFLISIINNNFIGNLRSLKLAYYAYSNIFPPILILHNYWNRPRLLPKLILGAWGIILPFPFIYIDMFPAKIPNDITLDDNI